MKEITPSEGYLLDEEEHDVVCDYEGDLVAEVSRSTTSAEQVIKQPFQLIKVSDNGDDTEAVLLAGAEFTAYLKSSLSVKADGSYDFDKATPVVIGENGATIITSDDKGHAVSIAIPYGTYVVVESKTPHNMKTIKPFEVKISENHPDKPQTWRVFLDREFTAKLRVIKKDSDTKQTVLVPNAEFKIFNIDKNEYVKQYTTYPSKVEHTSFFTDEDGDLILPEALKIGNYRIEEVKAPFGYVVNDNYINISVDTDTAFETDGDTNDAIITVEYSDAPAVGELTVEKKGEVLDGFKGGLFANSEDKEFVYKEGSLAGAVFKVYAAEDIFTADNQKDADGNRTKYYSKGDLVATLTTGKDGKAVAKNLPLGQYRVVEVTAPDGKCMRGAGDTVRSIIISANSRLAFLENKQVLRLLSKDELNLSDIGIGVNGDGETKTALFCVIPDSDKSYNFIIGMLYTQIFQELYYQADFNCGGRLPIHVTFMLDEFANVALPDDFCSLLSTMRSREISSIIIIQNFAQLKALFKDTWETIPGNCDTFIYLGGNEQSTHKYVSELLGKGTIDKKSSGETKGRQGSSSRNYDVLGRELFTPDEVRKLDNKKCIIFIRGFDPIMDNKFIPFNHPMFNQTADGKGEPYVHEIRGANNLIGPPFEILSDKAVKYYEKLKDKGENVYIDSLTYEQFMMLGDAELSRRFSMQDEAEQKAKIDREQANELEYVDESQKADSTATASGSSGNAGSKPVRNPEREKPKWEDTITNRMLHWSYTPEQKEELKMALAAGIPRATILTYFYPEVTVEKMSSYRKKQ